MHIPLESLLSNFREGKRLSPAEALDLVPLLGERPADMMAMARLAVAMADKPSFTCGIINAKSGRCPENCAFCAQSAHFDGQAEVYPMVGRETLLRRAEALAGAGVDFMGIVTSGTGPSEAECEEVCRTAGYIASRVDIKLCASFGLLTPEQARALKAAGFTSYHHNLETARSFYPEICSSHGYERRVDTVRNARAAGLRVCSGGIFGLGESWEQRVELAATLAELEPDCIPVNFLTPIPGTPLAGQPTLHPMEALCIVALYRFMHPRADIVVCGGRSNTLGEWDRLLPAAGATGMMVGDYLTTRGGSLERDMDLMRSLGGGAWHG